MSEVNAQKVLANAGGALGASDDVRAIRSLTALAHCRSARGPYTTELQSARGGRLRFTQRWPDRPTLVVTITKTIAWLTDQQTGAATPIDHEDAAAICGHDFQMLALDPLAYFHAPALIGEADFAGRRCYDLEMQDLLRRPCHAYFDMQTALWAGMRLPDDQSGNGSSVEVVIDRWRRIEAILLPAHVTASTASGTFTFDFVALSLNDVDEALFQPPPSLAPGAER